MSNTSKKMTNEEYCDNDGTKCPYCQSEDVDSDGIQVDGPSAWTEDSCLDCGESWITYYRIAGWAPNTSLSSED